MNTDNTAWLGGLKPGDTVAVFDLWGKRFRQTRTVEKITPTGRIVCTDSSVFRKDGFNHVARDSAYADRQLKPVPTE